VKTIESLKRRIEVLEQIVGSVDKSTDEIKEDKLMISQEMFVRQLNMLKRSAKFILDNVKVEEFAPKKEESKEFLRHLNNLQLTFDNLLTNQNKYTLTDETKKCIKEAEQLKEQLNKLTNDNWVIEDLFVPKHKTLVVR
jgi:translation initiation factor 2B subunit (eIF-2B alpha/beta/delta family)